MNVSCPDDVTLSRFLDGQLSDRESAEIDTHISSCQRCDAVVERMNNAPAGLMGVALAALQSQDLASMPVAPQATGYRVLNDVGRGGMGMVYRVQHEQLARTLAMKVLRSELSQSVECRDRFLNEAHINAGLQHPCIVPVHELGTTSDGRPFFSMKLVGGRTLESRLESRDHPSKDLPEFLRIFGLICSGVAYAHSQRVIHRDIKPANVMVGDFGEVQVMDWGLAKTLDSSHRPGLVRQLHDTGSPFMTYHTRGALGTYAYMPPEQALAQVELQDERCDVFSLGAVLCHLLTGAPPYNDYVELTIRQQAEQALLEPALKRLDECGADRTLIQLARNCLAVDRENRPRTASVVAQIILDHQNEMEHRLRRAEAERAAAIVQATEEKKRRRLTMALAASVIMVLVLLANGIWWKQQLTAKQDLERAEQISRVQNVVDQSMASLEQGNLSATHAALAQVDDRLLKVVSAELYARANSLRSELELALRLNELDDLRWQVLEGTVSEQDYFGKVLEAFQQAGIELLSADVDEVVRRIQQSTINATIIDFIDRWTHTMTDGQISRRLFHVASKSDAHPSHWKEQARNLDVRSNPESLKHLIQETPWNDASTSMIVSLAMQFGKQGGEVVPYLQRAQTAHPDDFWINSLLGQAIIGGPKDPKKGPKDVAIAIGYLRAALSARPQSVAAQSNLGVALASLGETREAIMLLEESVLRLPENYRVHLNLGVAYDEDRQFSRAIESFRRSLDLKKNHATTLYRLGVSLVKANQLDEAILAFEASINAEPQHSDVWARLGDVYGLKKEWATAIEKYRRALQIDPKLGQVHGNLSVALRNSGKLNEAIVAAQKAVALRGDRTAYQILANAYRDKGLVEEALDALRNSESAKP